MRCSFRVLWANVLMCTIEDAQGRVLGCNPKRNEITLVDWNNIVEDARRWLTEEVNPDRTFVCDAVGISERKVVAWARSQMKSPPRRHPSLAPSSEEGSALCSAVA